jgi:hypothetical protein
MRPAQNILPESSGADALAFLLETTNDASGRLPAQTGGHRPEGIVLGAVVDVAQDGWPLVSWTDQSGEHCETARSVVPADRCRIGAEVALAFPAGQSRQPLILGILESTASPARSGPLHANIDDERLLLTADREIVLRCGEASITLTRAGKVIVRGAYLSSQSSGVHRIKGGSVQIN